MERQAISAMGKWSLSLEYGARHFDDAGSLISPIIDTDVDGHPLASTEGARFVVRGWTTGSALLHLLN